MSRVCFSTVARLKQQQQDKQYDIMFCLSQLAFGILSQMFPGAPFATNTNTVTEHDVFMSGACLNARVTGIKYRRCSKSFNRALKPGFRFPSHRAGPDVRIGAPLEQAHTSQELFKSTTSISKTFKP